MRLTSFFNRFFFLQPNVRFFFVRKYRKANKNKIFGKNFKMRWNIFRLMITLWQDLFRSRGIFYDEGPISFRNSPLLIVKEFDKWDFRLRKLLGEWYSTRILFLLAEDTDWILPTTIEVRVTRVNSAASPFRRDTASLMRLSWHFSIFRRIPVIIIGTLHRNYY